MMQADRLVLGRLFPVVLLAVATPQAAMAQAGQKADVDPEHAAKMPKGLALFKEHVKPILVQTCLRCHGGKAIESELDLTARASLL